MSPALGFVCIPATLVGILLVGITSSAPDMFTALVDVERALNDEQSAALLLRQYVNAERQRLQQLELYIRDILHVNNYRVAQKNGATGPSYLIANISKTP